MKLSKYAAQACAVALCLAAPGSPAFAGARIVTFDPPGSVDTYPYAINMAATVTGYYKDGSNAYHGFLRTADGTITSFDVSGTNYTYPISISGNGAIAGYYQGSSHYDGFVRASNGTITTFDAYGDSTTPVAVNGKGVITGSYFDTGGNMWHAFVRKANGTTSSFDPSGSIASFPFGISDKGVIAGEYLDSHDIYHGFVRANDTITSFDPTANAGAPGLVQLPDGTFVAGGSAGTSRDVDLVAGI